MSYEHGRFVWFELLTKDVDRATSLYSETLPGESSRRKWGGGRDLMIQAGEAGVGGVISPQGDVPTAWVSYVSVPDVDAAAKKVVAAGGATHMDAFDAPGVGRMQGVSDSQGGCSASSGERRVIPRVSKGRVRSTGTSFGPRTREQPSRSMRTCSGTPTKR